MSAAARLVVTDAQGRREVPVDRPVFVIGRRTSADLQVTSRDASREHAEITREGDAYRLRDRGSRFGTFVNGEPVTVPRLLVHGDRISLGRADGVEIVFVSDDSLGTGLRSGTSAMPDFQQLAAIMDGLRALRSGRVLDEVLTLVLDSALEVVAAERGFIMLAGPQGHLEFTIARARGRRTLTGTPLELLRTSQKIPREVFETGRSLIAEDLTVGGLADLHQATVAAGIRHVLCVPLRVIRFAAPEEDRAEGRVIGVLYLDSHERGALVSSSTRASLEAFATQAALALDSARLYAESVEKARLDRDLRLAADMQRALLPAPRLEGATFDLSAVTVPCRTIGGDFYDYLDLSQRGFGFAVGDVAGKGPSAALLAAAVQSNFVAQAPVADEPADAMLRLNRALLRRVVEARFATMFFGELTSDGRLRYTNAGQDPPVLVQHGGTRWLKVGGPVLGLLPGAMYGYDTLLLEPGDLVVVCSDGVSEARNEAGEEFGRDRFLASVSGTHGQSSEAVLEHVLSAVREFVGSAPQADDITAFVIRHRGDVDQGPAS